MPDAMNPVPRRWRSTSLAAVAAGLLSGTLAGCGGGNPLDNPPDVSNSTVSGNRKLSFAYFQRCIQPILVAQLPVSLNGVTTVNSCASSGCHDDTSGTGGALRVRGSAVDVDLTDPANTPDVVRNTDMYRNFYSSQGEVVFANALASRIIAKPLVLNVLHGGGIVFDDVEDPNVRLMRYWIEHPMPEGQDEFSAAANALFTPADAATGECNVE
jgi:predicted small lipoprotein YifL